MLGRFNHSCQMLLLKIAKNLKKQRSINSLYCLFNVILLPTYWWKFSQPVMFETGIDLHFNYFPPYWWRLGRVGGWGVVGGEGGKGARWAETAARDEVLDYKRGRGCEDAFYFLWKWQIIHIFHDRTNIILHNDCGKKTAEILYKWKIHLFDSTFLNFCPESSKTKSSSQTTVLK